MPSLSDLKMVGEGCSEYDPTEEETERSCHSCQHWSGGEGMCELDIFWEQFTSLDQTQN